MTTTKKNLKDKVHMKELIKRIADVTDYHNYEVEDVLTGFRRVLIQYLLEGKEVQLEQVFTVAAKPIPPRKLINAKTREEYTSKGSVGLSIRPAKALKDELLPLLNKPK